MSDCLLLRSVGYLWNLVLRCNGIDWSCLSSIVGFRYLVGIGNIGLRYGLDCRLCFGYSLRLRVYWLDPLLVG